MKVIIVENYEEASQEAAKIFINQVKEKPNSILGLATGSTPVRMYELLREDHEKNHTSYKDVKSYNLDEYFGLDASHPQSYHYFMYDNLFNHININKENVHIPNGMAQDIDNECLHYDKMIDNSSGIDIQVLGIGNNAHIGFNEPTINFNKGTHVVTLDESTRKANARFFSSLEEVPTKAITMGTGSIFKSKKILLLASGKNKAEAIYNTVHGKVTPEVPSSILQFHQDVILILDKEAASLLSKDDYEVVQEVSKVK